MSSKDQRIDARTSGKAASQPNPGAGGQQGRLDSPDSRTSNQQPIVDIGLLREMVTQLQLKYEAALDGYRPGMNSYKNRLRDAREAYESLIAVLAQNGKSPVETTDVMRMRNTLVQAGYTDCGGELWKPPLGPRPVFLDENLRLREFLQLWTYEGRLQSFEDRERFRKEAAKLVTPEELPERNPFSRTPCIEREIEAVFDAKQSEKAAEICGAITSGQLCQGPPGHDGECSPESGYGL